MTTDTTAQDVYAWEDTETDGIVLEETNLLEIALILTTPTLEVLDEAGYHAVVKYTEEEVAALYANADPYVQDMHSKSGLWDRLSSDDAKPLEQIDDEVLAYIKRYAPNKRQARIAGNSVRLDLNMTEKYLPKTYAHLHYRSVDVSTLAETAEKWYGVVCPEKTLRHEAMSDILESIDQAMFLKDSLGLKAI